MIIRKYILTFLIALLSCAATEHIHSLLANEYVEVETQIDSDETMAMEQMMKIMVVARLV